MKRTLHTALCALALACGAGAAHAQSWPTGPIKLVVGAPPGGSADFVARMVSENFTKALGQAVVVDNRPGAGGVVAVKAATSAKPDGNTLLLFFQDNITIAPFLLKTLPYDPIKDLDYAGVVARSKNFFLVVHPNVPAQNFAELVRLAKAQPGKVTFATYGLGSFPHLSYEIMNSRAGIDMTHVPFKGGVESQQSVVAGNVNSVAGIAIIELIKGGRLRALAVGGSKRSPLFPDVPSFAELGHGDQIFGPVMYGVAAPAGMPRAILDRVAAETRKVADAPEAVDRLATFVSEPYWMPGEQFRSFAAEVIKSYQPIIARLGLANQ